jgi:diacylglycerol kinase (ATP)
VTATDAAAERSRPIVRRCRTIYNVNAGTKGGVPLTGGSVDRVRKAMVRFGLGDDLIETADETEAAAAVRDALDSGIDTIVAAGGDGTVGAIAEHLLGTATTLGILPLGSVMNIARSLGIPRDVEAAIEIIATGRERVIDVGEVGGRAFYEGASIGLNAAVFRELTRVDEPHWRSLPRTLWVALRYRPARMVLHLDRGQVRTRALMVTISNGPYTGAGMTVAPEARLDDGLFDIRVFRGFSKWELLRHLASITFGRRRYSPGISTYRSRRVRVTTRHPLPARADNRDLGTTPVEFVTRRHALRVVVSAMERNPRPRVRHRRGNGDELVAEGSSDEETSGADPR